MATFTITIDEKSNSGKHLIAKLKSAPGVSIRLVKTARPRRKAKLVTEDQALGDLMRKEETGELVSKDSVMKALRSIK